MSERGLFIALEGGDGSGKGTQAEMLHRRLSVIFGKNVLKMSFPRYGEPSAYWAGQFLDGAYGGVNDVHPDLASLPYAIDRFAAAPDVRHHLQLPNSVVITDRYIASNLAHNGAKFATLSDRRAFYERDMLLEYDILGIPRPNLNIVLLVDTAIAQANVDKKDARSYTDKKRDIHEADAGHLDRAKAAYQELCELYPEAFIAVNCMRSGVMRQREDINEEIVEIVEQRL